MTTSQHEEGRVCHYFSAFRYIIFSKQASREERYGFTVDLHNDANDARLDVEPIPPGSDRSSYVSGAEQRDTRDSVRVCTCAWFLARNKS